MKSAVTGIPKSRVMVCIVFCTLWAMPGTPRGWTQDAASTTQPVAERIQHKIQRLHAEVQRWQQEGRDPSPVGQLMQAFEPLMQQGRVQEAEARLDQALVLLGQERATTQTPTPGTSTEQFPVISQPRPVTLGNIPESAEIVFPAQDGFIYVMDRNGGHVAQITFQNPRSWEHVAVSFDHRFIVGGQTTNLHDPVGTIEALWLFDLHSGTEVRLVPDFFSAGNGGVDWDSDGYVYFHGQPKKIEGAVSPELVKKNNDASDIWKIKYDGTGLVNLTNTLDSGEFDVSTSDNGKRVVFVRQFFDAILPIEPYATIHNELWVMDADGNNKKLVYQSGNEIRLGGTFDPEFSDDNAKIVFSKVDTNVPPNYPSVPGLNTAHDIWIVHLDGTGLRRVTEPGPINIIPDWKGRDIVFSQISEKDNIRSWITATIRDDGTGFRRMNGRGGSAKWIPENSGAAPLVSPH